MLNEKLLPDRAPECAKQCMEAAQESKKDAEEATIREDNREKVNVPTK